MEFGDSGSMATKNNWHNAITVDLPVEATVISRQGVDWILHIERQNSHMDKRAYFRLTPESQNVGEIKRNLRIRDTITVVEAEHVVIPQTIEEAGVKFNFEPHRHVLSYTVPEQEQEPLFSEVVAVAAVTEHFILVVGTSFEMTAPGVFYRKPEGIEVTVGQFLMANCYRCDQGVRLRSFYHPLIEHNYYIYTQTFQKPRGDEPILHFPDDLRELQEVEKEWIRTRLSTKEGVTEDEALVYIRDPHIAVYALECYLDFISADSVTLRCRTITSINLQARSEKIILKFMLSEEEFHNCVISDSQHNWRTCTDLAAFHESLYSGIAHKMEPAYVRYLTSRIQADGSYEVDLVAEQRSDDLMRMVKDHAKKYEVGAWTIGPLCSQSDNVINAIKNGFHEFFHRRETFQQYAGWVEKAEDMEIPDKDQPFYVKDAPLDPHQLAFMKSAAHNPGWTCAQAPPGCGKTHTTSALVSYLNNMKVKGGVCISGTTNAAVTNAADAVKENFPEINIVRNYSAKAEYDITEKSGAISLKQMAKNCDQFLAGDEFAPVFKARKDHEKSVRAYTNRNFEKLSAQANAYGRMKETERALNNQFIRHYQMNVYATTVELLIRGGDKFASGVVRESEDYKDKAIKRIILDEAAQLSPSEALALYCSLPELTHVTLLGDSYQLGPHCRLEKGSDVYNFKTEGELTRMYQLPSTIKKNLNGLYRCHPLISEKILIPIYGDMMEPRVSAEERNMAARLKMPVASDGSPVMMFHVQGREEKCSNMEEVIAVSFLLTDLLMLYGAQEEDIVVLVFHRQQKIKLEDFILRSKSLDLKKKLRIETVDSFQGKEAKIIILSTTKSCVGDDRAESKLQFIADPQRATVAMSRAQHAFYLIGDLFLLSKSRFYAKIMYTLLPVDGFKNKSMSELKKDDLLQIRRNLNKTLADERKKEEKIREKERKEKREREKRERKEKREKKEKKKRAETEAGEAGAVVDTAVDPEDLLNVPVDADEVLEQSLQDIQEHELALLQAQLNEMGIETNLEGLEVNLIDLAAEAPSYHGNGIEPDVMEAGGINFLQNMILEDENGAQDTEINGNEAGMTGTPEEEKEPSPQGKRRAAKKPRQSRLMASFHGQDHSVCPVVPAGTAPVHLGTSSAIQEDEPPLIEI